MLSATLAGILVTKHAYPVPELLDELAKRSEGSVTPAEAPIRLVLERLTADARRLLDRICADRTDTIELAGSIAANELVAAGLVHFVSDDPTPGVTVHPAVRQTLRHER